MNPAWHAEVMEAQRVAHFINCVSREFQKQAGPEHDIGRERCIAGELRQRIAMLLFASCRSAANDESGGQPDAA